MATIRQTLSNTLDESMNAGVQAILRANTLDDLEDEHDLWVRVFNTLNTATFVMFATHNVSDRLKDEIDRACKDAITVLDRRYEMRKVELSSQ